MQQQTDLVRAILDTQLIGTMRSLIGLPLDHAFDRVKTFNQSAITIQSKQNFYLVAKQSPFSFFRAGFLSSFMITMLKQYYRWPMMILIPKKIQETSPDFLIQKMPYFPKVIAGLAIGLIEGMIICPLEFFKTQKMTSIDSRMHLNKQMYTGLNIVVLKQMISWSSYLYWDAVCRHSLKKSQNNSLTAAQIFMCSVATGILNIAAVAPFDTLKTLNQMKGNEKYANLSLNQCFYKVLKESGVRGLYSGSQTKFAQFFVQALLTTPVIDYMERNYGNY